MSVLAASTSTQRYRWVILGLALASQTAACFVLTSPSPLAALIQADLGLTKAEVGMISSAATAGAWLVVAVGGLLADRLGIRSVMSMSLFATALVMLAMPLTSSFPQTVAMVFAAGLMRGSVFPSSTKAVFEWFSSRSRATAMGIKQMGFPLSGIIVGALLPSIGLAVGWRYALAVPGVLIAIVGAMVLLLYRDSPSASRATSRGASMRTGFWELLRNRALLVLCLIAFISQIVQLAATTYLALYLDEVVLLDAIPDRATRLVAAGGFLAAFQLGGASGRAGWGLVSDLLFRGKRMIVLGIIGAVSAAISLTMSAIGSDFPFPLLTALVIVYGATVLGWNGVYNAVLTESMDHRYAATGVGLSMTITEAGSLAGPPIFGLLVDASHSYQLAWLTVAAASTAAAIITFAASRSLLARR